MSTRRVRLGSTPRVPITGVRVSSATSSAPRTLVSRPSLPTATSTPNPSPRTTPAARLSSTLGDDGDVGAVAGATTVPSTADSSTVAPSASTVDGDSSSTTVMPLSAIAFASRAARAGSVSVTAMSRRTVPSRAVTASRPASSRAPPSTPKSSATGSSTVGVIASVAYDASWVWLKVAATARSSTPAAVRTEKYRSAVAVYVGVASALPTPHPASARTKMLATSDFRRRRTIRNLCSVTLLSPRRPARPDCNTQCSGYDPCSPHGMLSTISGEWFFDWSTAGDGCPCERARVSAVRVRADWLKTVSPATNHVNVEYWVISATVANAGICATREILGATTRPENRQQTAPSRPSSSRTKGTQP